ncbi:MAG: phage tail assembly chaperone [Alphaproteobacteria bacterium]|nr:phage tail assembly chaperone [Alphaproteobacteria bacterium]
MPWEDLFLFAFHTLNLTPDQFWLMNLPELRLYLETQMPSSSFTRDDFNHLQQLYPDKNDKT